MCEDMKQHRRDRMKRSQKARDRRRIEKSRKDKEYNEGFGGNYEQL